MAYTILILFFAAFFSLVIPSRYDHLKGWIMSIFPFGIFVYFIFQMPFIEEFGGLTSSADWISFLGLDLSFTLDGLSLIFVLLISGIGGFILIYAREYMRSFIHTRRFYFYLLFFMGSMLGLVMSRNLLLLYVFWELTSVSSFLLIGFQHHKEEVRKAALQAFLVTFFGGLMMLAGFVLLGNIAGTYDIRELMSQHEYLISHPQYLVILLLILGGAFSKSAQFPFHFWLPEAMRAPSPVSAFLHSATMVKAGVYLLARINPVLGNTPEWQTIISFVGAFTMLVGAFLALGQKDLKSILAYTTISALGTLMLLIGIDTELSIKAALIFVIVHALYKGSLFMVTGSVYKQTGTRNVEYLGNLVRKMPITTVVAIMALFSMAGLPPMLGFISKEIIYEAKLQAPNILNFLVVFGVMANIFMVWVSLFIAYRVFLRPSMDTPKVPEETSYHYWSGPAILALGGLILGFFPDQLGEKLIQPALGVVMAKEVDVTLSLWHGIDQVFLISAFTIMAGFGFFFLHKHIIPVFRKIQSFLFRVQLSNVFFNFLEWILMLSRGQTKIIQHGYHRFYLMILFVLVALLGWYQIVRYDLLHFEMSSADVSLYILILAVIIIASSLFAVLSNSRMTAIISMGVVGYGLALIYLIFSAIDLAIVQLLIESLIVVTFVLVVLKLPRFAKLSSRATKIRDAIVAVIIGGFMTIVALQAESIDLYNPVSQQYINNALTQSFGGNIVNTILMDFRSLDAFGGIVILVVAALGIVALLKFDKK